MFFKSNRNSARDIAPLLLQNPPRKGFFAGTKVATRETWVAVEDLRVDDLVLTDEHGPQVITHIEHSVIDLSESRRTPDAWPIHIPKNVLGNTRPVIVAPDMRIVIRDDAAISMFGKDQVCIPAESLIGYSGVARARIARPLVRVVLGFTHGVGLICEGDMRFDLPNAQGAFRHHPLEGRDARALLRQMGSAAPRRGLFGASGWI